MLAWSCNCDFVTLVCEYEYVNVSMCVLVGECEYVSVSRGVWVFECDYEINENFKIISNHL